MTPKGHFFYNVSTSEGHSLLHRSGCSPEQTATSSRESCLRPSTRGEDSGDGTSRKVFSVREQHDFTGTWRRTCPAGQASWGSPCGPHGRWWWCSASQPPRPWLFLVFQLGGLIDFIWQEKPVSISPGKAFAHLYCKCFQNGLSFMPLSSL